MKSPRRNVVAMAGVLIGAPALSIADGFANGFADGPGVRALTSTLP